MAIITSANKLRVYIVPIGTLSTTSGLLGLALKYSLILFIAFGCHPTIQTGNGVNRQKLSPINEGIGFNNVNFSELNPGEIKKGLNKSFKVTKGFRHINFRDLPDAHIILEKYESKSEGIAFNFEGDRLSTIYLTRPFQGLTSKGIALGESTFKEVVQQYGNQPWSTNLFIRGRFLKSYSGISFYTKKMKLEETERDKLTNNQVSMDSLFLNERVEQIVLKIKPSVTN